MTDRIDVFESQSRDSLNVAASQPFEDFSNAPETGKGKEVFVKTFPQYLDASHVQRFLSSHATRYVIIAVLSATYPRVFVDAVLTVRVSLLSFTIFLRFGRHLLYFSRVSESLIDSLRMESPSCAMTIFEVPMQPWEKYAQNCLLACVILPTTAAGLSLRSSNAPLYRQLSKVRYWHRWCRLRVINFWIFVPRMIWEANSPDWLDFLPALVTLGAWNVSWPIQPYSS